MATCPQCAFSNPNGADGCARCGHAGLGGPPADIPVLADPILPLITPPPGSTPLPSHPALTLVGRGNSALTLSALPQAVSTSTPAPLTTRDLPSGEPVTIRNRAAARPAVELAVEPKSEPPADPPKSVPPPLRVRFVVLRGTRVGAEYPVYEGRNTIGRFVDKPVDIDLITQEAVEQTWCSRVHAAVTLDRGTIVVEDLNSLNGTWVNGARIHPGQPRQLKANDVVQVGTVQMKLVVG